MAIAAKTSSQVLDQSEAGDGTLADARLRALDAMLGGVAHDLNNALSVVLMNLDVMQQDRALGEKHMRRINGMLDATTKASALVRHLLSFSHSRRPQPEVVSIGEIVEALRELLQVAVGKEIEIVVETVDAAGPCCVVIDQASLEVGIAHAALQLAATMPAGGTLTFRLEKSEADDQVVLTLEVAPREAARRGNEFDGLDFALIEHLAHVADGRVVKTTGNGSYRLAVCLPASSETTVF